MARIKVKLDNVGFRVGTGSPLEMNGSANSVTFHFNFEFDKITCALLAHCPLDNNNLLSDVEELCPLMKRIGYASDVKEAKERMQEFERELEVAFNKKSFKHDDNAEIMWGN